MERLLRSGLDELGLELSDAQVTQLIGYAALLQKWSKAYNLTALRTPDEIVTHHLLDSLAVVQPLSRQAGDGLGELLDVGSGAGLPGAVLAICFPALQVDCLDAVAKKAAFVQQAAATLGLPNLRGVHSRIQDCKRQFPVITSRAFATLSDFVTWSGHALAAGGVWLAMKGKVPNEEIALLPAEVEVFHVEPLRVPHLAAERCIVWMRRRAA